MKRTVLKRAYNKQANLEIAGNLVLTTGLKT